MTLIIGGFAQGKLEYAKSVFGGWNVWNGKSVSLDFFKKTDESASIIWNDFHLSVRTFLQKACKTETLNSPEIRAFADSVLKFAKKHKNLAIISCEVGCGVVPIEESERTIREITGRLLVELAKIAESVERITCGIPQKIK